MKFHVLIFFIFSFVTSSMFGQKVIFKDNIAFVNDKAYVKILKPNKSKYVISNITSDENIIIVRTKKHYNSLVNKEIRLPKVTFVKPKKTWGFETKSIDDKTDVIRFIYNLKIVLPNGKINSQMAYNYYEYFKQLNNKPKF